MYESYEKKMEKINSSLERLLEEASIDYATLILQSEKLDIEFKLNKKSLLRKIEYYKNKIDSNLLESLENENVQDIIERTKFDILYTEKKYLLDQRRLNLEIEEKHQQILKLQSDLSVQNDRQLGLFD